MSIKIMQWPSPNHEDRSGASVELVVLHYDASPSDVATVKWLTTPRSQVSAHYVMGRKGEVTQLVHTDRTAWHCGQAAATLPDGRRLTNLNPFSIGIEIGNLGLLTRGRDGSFSYTVGTSQRMYSGLPPVRAALEWPDGHRVEGWWEPFPEAQLAAVAELLMGLANSGFDVAVRDLRGHDEVALPIGRKTDPGPIFPWQRFSRATPRPLKSIILP